MNTSCRLYAPKPVGLFKPCWLLFDFQGAPPVPAPLAVPSSTVLITEDHLITQHALPNHTETEKPDSEPDEDDLSMPPGVILVTTPIDDLSCNEEAPYGDSNATRSIFGNYSTSVFIESEVVTCHCYVG